MAAFTVAPSAAAFTRKLNVQVVKMDKDLGRTKTNWNFPKALFCEAKPTDIPCTLTNFHSKCVNRRSQGGDQQMRIDSQPFTACINPLHLDHCSGGSRISRGRFPPRRGGVQTPDAATFCKICMSNELGPLGGACQVCPLDPPMH